ncbi:MAG: glycosyltransferase family 4 protein [Burkholderiales bacterium]|nr:glycosyltransferase family 4 protein [Burkholderiales bacterium]
MLIVDTFSSHNDFTSELVDTLAGKVKLSVFTVVGSRINRGLPVRILPMFPAHYGGGSTIRRTYQALRSYVALVRELVAHRRGVVHVQFFRYMLVEGAVYLLLRPFLKNLIFTAHNVVPHEGTAWHRAFFRVWYAMVDHVHVLSQNAAQTLRTALNVPERKITVIPHGNYARLLRDLPPTTTGGARRSLGIPEGQAFVLFFGFLRAYKGVDRAIAAMCHLPRSLNALLGIVGMGSDEFVRHIEQTAAKLGITGRVMINPDHVSNRDLCTYIRAADVVVFPYLHIYQSGALVLALTLGKAIIASDIEGFREYVRAGETGLLCDTSDPSAFGEAIARVAGDVALRCRLGENARRYAEDILNWESIGQKMLALYQNRY